VEAVVDEAVPPAGDGVGVAAEFLGDAEVGGLIGLGTAQDKAGPEGETLGCQACVGNLGEAVVFVGQQSDPSRFASHGGTSVFREKRITGDAHQGRPPTAEGQEAICTRMFMLMPKTCETLA
jgi:hypothetical protein